jgi:hypothetical protein
MPSPDAAFRSRSPHGARPARPFREALLAALLAAAACHSDPPPVAPGEPIAASPELVLDTMDAECDGLVTAFGRYKQCANLDDDDRFGIDGWIQRAQEDFAAGKKASPDAGAQHAIAAACHKAIASVDAASERCHNGPKPRR